MSRTLPVAIAKAQFSECLREAESGEPVIITRHGRAVVALVPAEDLDQVLRLRAARKGGGLASLAGTFAEDQLADTLVEITRTRSAPRPTPDLE